MFGIWECKVNENHQQYSQKPHAVRASNHSGCWRNTQTMVRLEFWCTENMHGVR